MAFETFFARYARLSMAGDARPLAALYAPTFIVGGPDGSTAFTNDAAFLAWLDQVFAFNQQQGMRTLDVVSVRDTALSPRHSLATVKRW